MPANCYPDPRYRPRDTDDWTDLAIGAPVYAAASYTEQSAGSGRAACPLGLFFCRTPIRVMAFRWIASQIRPFITSDLAAATGINVKTVRQIVADALALGFIREAGFVLRAARPLKCYLHNPQVANPYEATDG